MDSSCWWVRSILHLFSARVYILPIGPSRLRQSCSWRFFSVIIPIIKSRTPFVKNFKWLINGKQLRNKCRVRQTILLHSKTSHWCFPYACAFKTPWWSKLWEVYFLHYLCFDWSEALSSMIWLPRGRSYYELVGSVCRAFYVIPILIDTCRDFKGPFYLCIIRCPFISPRVIYNGWRSEFRIYFSNGCEWFLSIFSSKIMCYAVIQLSNCRNKCE